MTGRSHGAAVRLGCALAAAVASAPGAATASGLDAPIVGSGQSGPTTADAAAVHWNPAQLAFVKRSELMLGGALVIGRAAYQRDRLGAYQTPDTLQFKAPVDPAFLDPNKRGPAEEVTATPVAPTGDAFLAVPAIGDRLVIGAGAYVPYAAALSLPADGAQAYQLRDAFIVASHVTVSAGARINEWLALGAGVSYVGGFAELSKLQDFASLSEFHRAFASDPINQDNDFGPDAPTEVRELGVLSRPISVKGAISHGATFNLGAALRPRDDLTLGLTYQHGARMHYKGRFAIDMNDDYFTQDLASQGLRYEPLVEGDAEIAFSLPRRVTAGAAYDADDKLRLDGFISYVAYSDVDAFVVETSSPDLAQPRLGIGDSVKVTLPRNWNDTVWIEAAVRYRLSDRLLASASFGYQSPASPDETVDISSIDGHRLVGGLGGVFDASASVSLAGDLRLQGMLPRTVTTSANDLGNGTYNLFIATVGGHLKILL